MKKLSVLFAAVSITALFAGSQKAYADETPQMSIVCIMDADEVYENEPVRVVVTLRSESPDIAFVKKTEGLSLKKGKFATLQTVEPAGEPYTETLNGRKFYFIPLDAYMITMDEKGKYTLKNGDYQIGLFFDKIVTDPIKQKKYRDRRVRQFNIPVENKSFKVKALPKAPLSMNYSGSVGKFNLETVIPRGDIFLDEEATALVVLRGTGMIAESTLPEYQDAFRNGVKLKSVSESRDEGHIRGKMMSELTLECTFIPTDRKTAEIGEVRFDYFDPEIGKYCTAVSKPVKVDVKSATAKREKIAI